MPAPKSKGYFLDEVAPQLHTVLNSISLAAALVTCGLLVGLNIKKPQHMNRVTLRLQLGIAIVDIIRHLRIALLRVDAKSFLCTMVAMSGFLGDHLYLFLNVAIAVNLQILIIHKLQPNRKIQLYLWGVVLLIAVIMNIIPLAMGSYGKDTQSGCYLKVGTPYRWELKLLLVHISIIPGLICCLIFPIWLFIHLSKNHSQVSTLAKRVALYPLCCFLSLIGYSVYSLAFDMGKTHNQWLLEWCRAGLRCSGLLHFIVLLLDPSIQSAIKAIRYPNHSELNQPEFSSIALKPETTLPNDDENQSTCQLIKYL